LKILISHDVDHLYVSDHLLRDLIIPKLWIRSFFELLSHKIGIKIFLYRLISIFDNRLNKIPEIIEFDKKYNIPSIFFFGMDNALGLSYKKQVAAPWIEMVLKHGFDAGVHGINYESIDLMQKEYRDFSAISNLKSFGIRLHYVRYNEFTFNKISKIGYLFDSSEFNKTSIELKSPYRIGNMWEFPLCLMDGYIMKYDLETAKSKITEAFSEAKKLRLEYFTFLFHDYLFNENTYPKHKELYEWFVNYCISQEYVFVSYREAIHILASCQLDDV
jgi:hypothetical protein